MQKNFTHFITAVNRSKNHRTLLAALLLFMLLLLAKSASAQTTSLYTDDFNTTKYTTAQILSTGTTIGIVNVDGNNQLRIRGNNPSSGRGYNLYIVTQKITLRPGFTYKVNVKARIGSNNPTANGKLEITRGSTIAQATASGSTNRILSSPPAPPSNPNGYNVSSTSFQDFSSSTFQGTGDQYIGFYVFRTGTSNFEELYLDDIEITETCNSSPTLTINQPAAVCGGTVDITTTINTNSTTPGLTFKYYTDANATNEITAAAAKIVGTTGTYYIKGTSIAGCYDIKPVTVTINQKPEVAIITGSDDVCINSTITLANATLGGVWSSSDENIAIVSTNGVVLGKVAGIVTISYTVTTPNTTCSTTATKQITVNTLPIAPTLAASSTTSICSGGTATLTAENGPANGSYKWYSTSTGGSSLFTGPTYTTDILTNTNAAASSFVYYVESVNEGGCASETRTPVTVFVYALPTAGPDQAKCAVGPTSKTTFTLFGSTPFGSLEWSVVNGNATIDDDNKNNAFPTITVTGIGSAIIRLTSTGEPNNPCGVKTDDIVLTVNPIYNNALDATPITVPEELEYFKPAKFVANPANNDLNWTYKWTVFYKNAPAVTVLTDNNNDAELNLTAEEMNINFDYVEVIQVAPTGVPCVAIESARERTPIQTILPVELIYLKADKKNDNVVALEWATAMEKNSEGFEVQVSQDAQNYRTLAFVASKAGGNTNQKQVYTFHDKENGKYGVRYYRLMQRDINGDSEYFGPKAVQIGEAIAGLSAFPNAFTSEVNLEVNTEEAGTMHVLVTNTTGATVLERTVKVAKGNNRELLQFNNGLPKGLYFVTTRLNGKTNHIKLLKR
ncbi:Ig-like domain-containing protein [Adhaeribacter rhizoryzae]|uniref:T9SS type A sorting domain-containing protein n=1 Tax=Adhaeribacter rhizoryzae TaxID=2607907 RepID=A0A5M6DBR9_9BACT|nr:T9SS type A sorting domain-containing protein [Adhaeribacter rhizoryzae]KAA5544991.1 T9SS type A sorting domain-containing protein [Adhaeribacter rhizoryzae]